MPTDKKKFFIAVAVLAGVVALLGAFLMLRNGLEPQEQQEQRESSVEELRQRFLRSPEHTSEPIEYTEEQKAFLEASPQPTSNTNPEREQRLREFVGE